MSKRRVGGSGWAGVYGSFIGLGKASAKAAGVRLKSASKAAKTKQASRPAPDLNAIELALRSPDERVQRAAKRVRAVQVDIKSASGRLASLTGQLHALQTTLADELARVDAVKRPLSKDRTSRHSKTK